MPLSIRTWLYRRNSRHSCLTNSAPDYVYRRNCFASLIRFGSRTLLIFELNRGFGEFNGCSLRLPVENWKVPGIRFWISCFADEPRSLLGSNFFLWRERAKCHHDYSSYIFSFSNLCLQYTPNHNPPSHPLKHAPTTNKSKISQNITPLPKTKLYNQTFLTVDLTACCYARSSGTSTISPVQTPNYGVLHSCEVHIPRT